tara:strand:+ start:351 stop:686 length:336 start_codon:yes stop_codon:yes gene_type:complete
MKINTDYEVRKNYLGKEDHFVIFKLPNETVEILIQNTNDYYPEDKETYRYPTNPDDGMVYDLGDDTYTFGKFGITKYDMEKIKFRRMLIREWDKQDGFNNQQIEINDKYFK